MLKDEMKNRFGYSDEVISESCKKGVFPYDYLTGPEVLDEPNLPEMKHFISKLKNEDINDSLDETQLKASYDQACKVFKLAGCKNIRDYLQLYLRIDVLLLAEVFHAFRMNMFDKFELDPAGFITLPSYSQQAALLDSKIRIALISDSTIFTDSEDSIRGGLTTLVKSKVVFNDPGTKEFNILLRILTAGFVDVNSLYPALMKAYVKSLLEDKTYAYQLSVDYTIPEDVQR